MNTKDLNAVGITADDMVLSKWDIVEYLEDKKDIQDYIKDALQEAPDDIKYINRVFGNAIKAHNIIELAYKTGIARETIYKITRGEGNPTLSTLSKLAEALGFCIRLSKKTNIVQSKKTANA